MLGAVWCPYLFLLEVHCYTSLVILRTWLESCFHGEAFENKLLSSSLFFLFTLAMSSTVLKDFQMHLDCSLQNYTKRHARHLQRILSDHDVIKRTQNCRRYFSREIATLPPLPPTQEELDFPMAFAFGLHQQVGRSVIITVNCAFRSSHESFCCDF